MDVPHYTRTGIILGSSLTTEQRFLLLVLNNYLGSNGRCWPSVATIADETGWSPRTVQRHLRCLESSEFAVIKIRTRASMFHGRQSNVYWIDWPRLRELARPPRVDSESPAAPTATGDLFEDAYPGVETIADDDCKTQTPPRQIDVGGATPVTEAPDAGVTTPLTPMSPKVINGNNQSSPPTPKGAVGKADGGDSNSSIPINPISISGNDIRDAWHRATHGALPVLAPTRREIKLGLELAGKFSERPHDFGRALALCAAECARRKIDTFVGSRASWNHALAKVDAARAADAQRKADAARALREKAARDAKLADEQAIVDRWAPVFDALPDADRAFLLRSAGAKTPQQFEWFRRSAVIEFGLAREGRSESTMAEALAHA